MDRAGTREGVSVRRRKMPTDVVVWNTARRLRYTAGKTECVVLTSMTDAARFPATEVAALVLAQPDSDSRVMGVTNLVAHCGSAAPNVNQGAPSGEQARR